MTTRPNYYRTSMRVKHAKLDEDGYVADVECFDAIDALGFDKSFALGNVLKYLWRAGRKTPDALADLKKALVYLEREIAKREQEAAQAAVQPLTQPPPISDAEKAQNAEFLRKLQAVTTVLGDS